MAELQINTGFRGAILGLEAEDVACREAVARRALRQSLVLSSRPAETRVSFSISFSAFQNFLCLPGLTAMG